MQKIAAIIAGAGAGTRLGAQLPKALVPLAGKPLFIHAINGMRQAGIAEIIVTIPAEFHAQFTAALAAENVMAKLAPGGATRQESVAKGLAATNADYVLIHDAARALTPPAMIRAVCAKLQAGAKSVIPALPVADTIKRGQLQQNHDGTARVYVTETLPRSELYAVQTPQGFSRELLRKAHQAGAAFATREASALPDDAALVELSGETVEIIPGHPHAMKITTQFDLTLAQLLLASTEN